MRNYINEKDERRFNLMASPLGHVPRRHLAPLYTYMNGQEQFRSSVILNISTESCVVLCNDQKANEERKRGKFEKIRDRK